MKNSLISRTRANFCYFQDISRTQMEFQDISRISRISRTGGHPVYWHSFKMIFTRFFRTAKNCICTQNVLEFQRSSLMKQKGSIKIFKERLEIKLSYHLIYSFMDKDGKIKINRKWRVQWLARLVFTAVIDVRIPAVAVKFDDIVHLC